MKKQKILFSVIASLLLLAAAACQPALVAWPVITAENAAQLTPAVQSSEISAISELDWSADGSSLVALSSSGALSLDGSTLEKREALVFESPAILYAAANDGKTLANSPDGLEIRIVSLDSKVETLTLSMPYPVSHIDLSGDGSQLLTVSMEDILVSLWDISNGQVVQTLTEFETAAPVYSAFYGEDGRHIIWVARGSVQLSPIDGSNEALSFGHEDFVTSAALSPDGKWFATAAAGTVDGVFQPVIYLWQTTDGSPAGMLTHPDGFNEVTFSPDGQLLAAASGKTILIWDLANMQQAASLENDGETVLALAFKPDGTALASADSAGGITLWSIPK